jgi:hypothetical protein
MLNLTAGQWVCRPAARPGGGGGRGAALRWLLLLPVAVACLWLLGSASGMVNRSGLAALPASILLAVAGRQNAAADTLVVYIYSNTDEQYETNLRFFLRHGVSPPGGGADYVVVLQEVRSPQLRGGQTGCAEQGCRSQLPSALLEHW